MSAQRDDAVHPLSRQAVREAMLGLSREHREVIVEIYFRGRSCVDTAALLGIPECTVKSRALLALRALRARLAAVRANASAGTPATG